MSLLPFLLAGFVAPASASADPSLADQVATAASHLDWYWTCVAAFLVFFMQAGFAFLGAGLIRAKNTTNYMTKSFMDFAIASLSWLCLDVGNVGLGNRWPYQLLLNR